MIGLYGIQRGTASAQWRPVSANLRAGSATAVSRTQLPATDQPVTPVTAARPVRRELPSAVSLTDGTFSPYRAGADPVELAVRSRIQYLSPEEVQAQIEASKSPQEIMAESECQTCKERKYQDGSNDPGVSFKTPTNVAPEQAAAAVRGHEQEHVAREQSSARREGREVVSQSVTYHTAICPECGQSYVSGGTTRTVTQKAQETSVFDPTLQGRRTPFSVTA